MSLRIADQGGLRPAVVRSEPAISSAEHTILSLLLVDAGAFRTAREIARHTALPVAEIKAAIGRLFLLGFLNSALLVTDTGRDALARQAP